MTAQKLIALAGHCDERSEEAAEAAISNSVGGRGSMEWIREAADYATVAAALRARASQEPSA